MKSRRDVKRSKQQTSQSKLKTKRQVSSGGVIYRKKGRSFEFAIALSSAKPVWHLPKGLVETDEPLEKTAAREVMEETGLTGENRGKIDKTDYWYISKAENIRIHKTVHFFLFKQTGGSTDNHDWEVEEVRWLDPGEAIKTLSYSGERDVVEKAIVMLNIGKPEHDSKAGRHVDED